MSKWVVDIHGDIEGDYDIIKKYDESKTDLLNKIRAEIEELSDDKYWYSDGMIDRDEVLEILDKYKSESEE